MRRIIPLLSFVLLLVRLPYVAPAGVPLPHGRGSDGSAAGQKPSYEPLIISLDRWLAEEIVDKDVPALLIALVDDQTLVWAKGYGFADPQAKIAATSKTLGRVGSVSKPITALLLMMLVEQGLIDLDAPVQKYLPDFRPKNTSGKEITLRQMLCHRSGVVRESPVGSYFDDKEPSLAATVASLNGLELVYPPETKTSYSNSALATVGLTLETTQKTPFAKLIQEKLLDPIGMKDSSYAPHPELKKRLGKAFMWTYHGTKFPAPTWELGMASAGNLYSTAEDQARLLSFLFAGGKTADGKQLLQAKTLDSMYQIQFAKPKDEAGFGLGFFVSKFEGRRRITHGGAVYGYATQFSALPDDKLGVIVIASKDVANGLTRRVSEIALGGMLAARDKKPLPAIERTKPLPPETAQALAGRYEAGKKSFELQESFGRLYHWPGQGGMRLEIRQLDDKTLIIDDAQDFGMRIRLNEEKDKLSVGKDEYTRTTQPKPEPVNSKWRGLVGEYGPDFNVLYILEKDGKLQALIEWVFLYPLEEKAPDSYQFPDFGLYHGDKVIFQRDASGKATQVTAGNVLFKRRALKGEDSVFQITPVRPVEELRKAALAATPPEEKNPLFKKPDLVDVTAIDPTIKLDIRYANKNNFLGTPVYTLAKAYLQRPAALALGRAHKKLAKDGYGLLIHDAYRPWHITKVFRDATPSKYHLFVADPSQGSRHNRGCAVDLTLYDLKTGAAVEMVSGYDEFSERSYPDYPGGTSEQRWHRDLLRRAMEGEGFTVYNAEWWHFDYRDWRNYPIRNATFEELGK